MVTESNNHNAAVQAAPPRAVLPVLMLTMFSTIFNLRVLGPILVDISVDFEISVATAGSLAVAYALPFAIVALFVGPLSDKYGRRRMMVIGIGRTWRHGCAFFHDPDDHALPCWIWRRSAPTRRACLRGRLFPLCPTR